jgi:hypothetical protein
MEPVDKLPSAALDQICARMRAEGISSELRVVKETQPIMTPAALQGLGDSSFAHTSPNRDAVEAMLTTPMIPVEQGAKSCASRFISQAEVANLSDVMVLQFSPPFLNPFGHDIGTLARISLGGASSTWYWVPLVHRDGHWYGGPPMPLPFIE